jgi:hypothetical protein
MSSGGIVEALSACLVCRQAAEYFEQRDNIRCYFKLGQAVEFDHRTSCATCQNIWNLVKTRACPKTAGPLCELCTVRLSYSKLVPTGYIHVLVLEVSQIDHSMNYVFQVLISVSSVALATRRSWRQCVRIRRSWVDILSSPTMRN